MKFSWLSCLQLPFVARRHDHETSSTSSTTSHTSSQTDVGDPLPAAKGQHLPFGKQQLAHEHSGEGVVRHFSLQQQLQMVVPALTRGAWHQILANGTNRWPINVALKALLVIIIKQFKYTMKVILKISIPCKMRPLSTPVRGRLKCSAAEAQYDDHAHFSRLDPAA